MTSATATDSHRHARTTLMAYGIPALPLAALLLPVYIYLPSYYADDLGLGLAVVGLVRLVSGLFDVFTDPLVGMISDRSKNRFGRRKIFVLLGAPVTMLGTWMLLVPFGTPGFIYMMMWSCVMYLGWTMMYLPLSAMSTELTHGYHERSRLAAYREGMSALGTLLILALVSYISISEGEQDVARAVWAIAIFVCCGLPLSILLFMWRVPDPQLTKKERKHIGFYKGIKILKKNTPFKKLIFNYSLNSFANGLPAILIIMFVENVLGKDEAVGPYLFAYFLCGLVFLPFWIKLSNKITKHKAWCISMLWACLVFLAVPFVGEGDTTLFMAICILSGMSVGADLALPSSMQADVVDIDLAETGERRAGLYFAMWSMMTKLSLALAAGISLPVLDYMGWPEENAFAIVILYALVPITVKLIVIFNMWLYPLDRAALSAIQLRKEKLAS